MYLTGRVRKECYKEARPPNEIAGADPVSRLANHDRVRNQPRDDRPVGLSWRALSMFLERVHHMQFDGHSRDGVLADQESSTSKTFQPSPLSYISKGIMSW